MCSVYLPIDFREKLFQKFRSFITIPWSEFQYLTENYRPSRHPNDFISTPSLPDDENSQTVTRLRSCTKLFINNIPPFSFLP